MTALSNIEQRIGFDDWYDFPRLGKCPLSPDVVVRVRFRGFGESRDTYKASQLRWERFPGQSAPLPFDIIGYRVAGK